MPPSPHLSINTRKGWLDIMVSDAHEEWQGRFGVSVPLSESGPLNAQHIARLRQIADYAERMLKPREPAVFDWKVCGVEYTINPSDGEYGRYLRSRNG